MKIQDTQTDLYLTYNAAGEKTWVSSESEAHVFTDEEADIVLESLNEGGSQRFVGRPTDRQK